MVWAGMVQSVYEELTWYDATAHKRSPAHELKNTVRCDVCVIGGGLAGLTTALELVRRGKMVVLLEAGRVGSGASGRNGGFVSNGFALGIDKISKIVGSQAARELFALSRVGTDYVADQIQASDSTIRMGNDMLVAVRHPDKGGLRAHHDTLRNEFGEHVEFLSQAETRQFVNTDRYFESLLFPEAFHIHPLRYVHLMFETLMAHGAMVAEYVPADSITRKGAAFSVAAGKGRVECEHVVVCLSSYDRKLHPVSGRAVLPVMTYVAVTEPLDQEVIRTSAAIADTRRAGDYFRLVDQGRLLWGGKITTALSRPKRLGHILRNNIKDVFPDLGHPRIDYDWIGQMAYALHKMPLIGRDQTGIWYATGFGGHGINTTAMAGLLISSAIADGDDTYRRFEPFAPQWALGPLGRAAVQGSYWWMQARDHWDEARI
jgi:gamma-glutamylputrescine oxidase